MVRGSIQQEGNASLLPQESAKQWTQHCMCDVARLCFGPTAFSKLMGAKIYLLQCQISSRFNMIVTALPSKLFPAVPRRTSFGASMSYRVRSPHRRSSRELRCPWCLRDSDKENSVLYPHRTPGCEVPNSTSSKNLRFSPAEAGGAKGLQVV